MIDAVDASARPAAGADRHNCQEVAVSRPLDTATSWQL
jgi:hypothetical protein